MLGKTHTRIAEEIGKRLKLTKAQTELLKQGSTRPDMFEDFPHHRGKTVLTIEKIFDARALFLKGDDEAFVKLGEALHYTTDRWTLRPRTRDKHTAWEQEIESQEIESDKSVQKHIENAAIPTKIKNIYLALLENLCAIFQKLDFQQWELYLPKKLVENELYKELYKELEDKDLEDMEDFRRTFGINMLYIGFLGTFNESSFKGLEYYPGGAFLPSLVSEALKNVRSEYSTSYLDLNFAFRVCLVISHLVLTPKIILLPKKGSLTWEELPLNWIACINGELEREGEKSRRLEEAQKRKKELEEARERKWWKKREGEKKEGSGCFIATAAYGTESAREIVILRSFRDNLLIHSRAGRRFVHFYYAHSPPIAEQVSKHESLKLLVRSFIDPTAKIIKRVVLKRHKT